MTFSVPFPFSILSLIISSSSAHWFRGVPSISIPLVPLYLLFYKLKISASLLQSGASTNCFKLRKSNEFSVLSCPCYHLSGAADITATSLVSTTLGQKTTRFLYFWNSFKRSGIPLRRQQTKTFHLWNICSKQKGLKINILRFLEEP